MAFDSRTPRSTNAQLYTTRWAACSKRRGQWNQLGVGDDHARLGILEGSPLHLHATRLAGAELYSACLGLPDHISLWRSRGMVEDLPSILSP